MKLDVKEMEIADYNVVQNIKAVFYRLWKLKGVVFLTTIIAALIAVIYVTAIGKKYTFYSSATIYSAVYGSYSETVSGVSIMNNYSGILGTSRVCDRAAAIINDPQISSSYLQSLVSSGRVSLSGTGSSSKSYGYRLLMSTRLEDPTNVVLITNAMAEAFSSEINELLGGDVVQVFDKASNSFMSAGTSNYIIVAILSAAGFVVSIGIICIKEFFSSKVQIVSQCEMDKDKILGILPFIKQKDNVKV